MDEKYLSRRRQTNLDQEDPFLRRQYHNQTQRLQNFALIRQLAEDYLASSDKQSTAEVHAILKTSPDILSLLICEDLELSASSSDTTETEFLERLALLDLISPPHSLMVKLSRNLVSNWHMLPNIAKDHASQYLARLNSLPIDLEMSLKQSETDCYKVKVLSRHARVEDIDYWITFFSQTDTDQFSGSFVNEILRNTNGNIILGLLMDRLGKLSRFKLLQTLNSINFENAPLLDNTFIQKLCDFAVKRADKLEVASICRTLARLCDSELQGACKLIFNNLNCEYWLIHSIDRLPHKRNHFSSVSTFLESDNPETVKFAAQTLASWFARFPRELIQFNQAAKKVLKVIEHSITESSEAKELDLWINVLFNMLANPDSLKTLKRLKQTIKSRTTDRYEWLMERAELYRVWKLNEA